MIIGNLVLTYLISRHLNKLSINKEEKNAVRRLIIKILRYPVIQFICLLPPSINKLIRIITGHHNFYMYMLHIIIVSCQGLFFSIAYGYNKRIMIIIKNFFKKVFCCNKSVQEEEDYSDLNSLNRTYDSFIKDKSFG